VTTVGDITFFFLCDLFTDSSWQHSTIDGVVNWTTLEAECPHAPASYAWFWLDLAGLVGASRGFPELGRFQVPGDLSVEGWQTTKYIIVLIKVT
jgi:hypothetical protein